MKKLILIVISLVFVACLNIKKEVKPAKNYAPLNPLVVYMHKGQLMLQGPVQAVEKDERYDREGNMTYNFGDTLIHSKDKIIHKLGQTTTTYLKDENGRIYKGLFDASGAIFTNYTYNEQGLLASEYGTENNIVYSTIYNYDDKGRITQSSYNYGEDPTQNVYYTYNYLGNNILQITITYNEEDQDEIYEYTNGYMTSHARFGKKTTYSYTWDKHGNWITQTVSNGGTNKRKITYYE